MITATTSPMMGAIPDGVPERPGQQAAAPIIVPVAGTTGRVGDGMSGQSTDRQAGTAPREGRPAAGSDALPPHWQRTATHYERRPWQPRVMVLYSLTALRPPRFAWRYERTTSLWIYASVAEAIAAVEAVLVRQARQVRRCPAVPNLHKRRRFCRADPRQLDLFSPLPIDGML
jgi:hypothetical protein